MSPIAVVNQAFREIEADELVVQRARMSRATRDRLYAEGSGFMDKDKLWTATVEIDDTIPYGEIDLSPDNGPEPVYDKHGNRVPQHDPASGMHSNGAGVIY